MPDILKHVVNYNYLIFLSITIDTCQGQRSKWTENQCKDSGSISMIKISQSMTEDHRCIDQVFVEMERAITKSEWEDAWLIADSFDEMMERHFSIEEDVLFPAIEEATASASGPVRVMTMEHDQIRYLVNVLRTAITEQSRDNGLSASETLLMMIQQHNSKEESVLYPMADRTVQTLEGEVSRRISEAS
ncbi:MAG: hemerythrin domain-containing protein [Candidatus Thiodiazotropha taylori]|nr:hemerythrin domain-containing protein [Candidatus Thiodiazotropha taylori]